MTGVKQKGELHRLFKSEGWDKIAFWADGSWADVGTGYGGEQSGNTPIFYLSRRNFYDTTRRERRAMIQCIDAALEAGGMPNALYFYDQWLMGVN